MKRISDFMMLNLKQIIRSWWLILLIGSGIIIPLAYFFILNTGNGSDIDLPLFFNCWSIIVSFYFFVLLICVYAFEKTQKDFFSSFPYSLHKTMGNMLVFLILSCIFSLYFIIFGIIYLAVKGVLSYIAVKFVVDVYIYIFISYTVMSLIYILLALIINELLDGFYSYVVLIIVYLLMGPWNSFFSSKNNKLFYILNPDRNYYFSTPITFSYGFMWNKYFFYHLLSFLFLIFGLFILKVYLMQKRLFNRQKIFYSLTISFLSILLFVLIGIKSYSMLKDSIYETQVFSEKTTSFKVLKYEIEADIKNSMKSKVLIELEKTNDKDNKVCFALDKKFSVSRLLVDHQNYPYQRKDNLIILKINKKNKKRFDLYLEYSGKPEYLNQLYSPYFLLNREVILFPAEVYWYPKLLSNSNGRAYFTITLNTTFKNIVTNLNVNQKSSSKYTLNGFLDNVFLYSCKYFVKKRTKNIDIIAPAILLNLKTSDYLLSDSIQAVSSAYKNMGRDIKLISIGPYYGVSSRQELILKDKILLRSE